MAFCWVNTLIFLAVPEPLCIFNGPMKGEAKFAHFGNESRRAAKFLMMFFDPLGRTTVTTSSDHCFHTCCPYVCLSVRPHFSKSSKTKQISSVGLAKWIIDDTCLVSSIVLEITM